MITKCLDILYGMYQISSSGWLDIRLFLMYDSSLVAFRNRISEQ